MCILYAYKLCILSILYIRAVFCHLWMLEIFGRCIYNSMVIPAAHDCNGKTIVATFESYICTHVYVEE